MKIFGIVAAVVLIIACIGTPVEAKKAGEITDSVFQDSEFGYSLVIPGGWSASVKNAKYALRLTMDQKAPVPPYQFQGTLRDYMQIPTMAVIVDTTSLNANAFVDSLLSTSFDSDQKKFLLKYLKIITRTYELVKRQEITFQGDLAVLMEVRQPYEVTVAQGRSDKADVVNDNKYGTIFVTVRNGHAYIISMICEYRTSEAILGMYDQVIKSLKFGTDEGAAKEGEKKG